MITPSSSPIGLMSLMSPIGHIGLIIPITSTPPTSPS